MLFAEHANTTLKNKNAFLYIIFEVLKFLSKAELTFQTDFLLLMNQKVENNYSL